MQGEGEGENPKMWKIVYLALAFHIHELAHREL